MKIIVIGATGTIGSAVADALAVRHEVVRASRTSGTGVDVEDPASVAHLFATVPDVDAVVSCATGAPERGQSLFGPLDQLTEDHLQITMMAAGLEGFVPAAALDMPRGTRINAVSPGWVKETMESRGMDSAPGMPAKTLAGYYVTVVEGTSNGVVVDPTA